eukprot:3840805-Rhodomonas_salina.1
MAEHCFGQSTNVHSVQIIALTPFTHLPRSRPAQFQTRARFAVERMRGPSLCLNLKHVLSRAVSRASETPRRKKCNRKKRFTNTTSRNAESPPSTTRQASPSKQEKYAIKASPSRAETWADRHEEESTDRG